MTDVDWSIETKAVQAGYEPGNGEPRVVPIAQSTTYKYDDAESVARLFDLEAEGHIYSRISNPTVAALEAKMAALDGGVGALALSSGQSAAMVAILNICGSGDHIVSSSTIYGGVFNLFRHSFAKLGVEVDFVDPAASADELSAALKPNTKAVYAETIANPALTVPDFAKFAAAAHSHGVPLVIDNTFATPFLCRPIEHGADIVIYSATKYLDGHAVSVGGVIVDSGNFAWDNERFPGLSEPDPSYHGVVYTERFGRSAYIIKARTQLLRDFGCCLSPFNSFLTNMGLETLHVRMERHCRNALALAEFLSSHPQVSWVRYPWLEADQAKEMADKYLRGGGGVLTFGVKGGAAAGERLMNSLKLAAIVVHVCDLRTSVLHPASMTHRQLNEAEQTAAGVAPDLVRVSVGLEHIDDLKADFDQALNAGAVRG